MRGRNRNSTTANIAVVALTLAASGGMIFWFTLMPRGTVAERKAAIAGHAINTALTAYAFNHHGAYPPTASITGGPDDALVRGGFLMFYPPNPFAPSRGMRMTPPGAFSPGDFFYERNPKKVYEYRLIVFGAAATSGRGRNGAVYYRGFE